MNVWTTSAEDLLSSIKINQSKLAHLEDTPMPEEVISAYSEENKRLAFNDGLIEFDE